MKIIAHRGNINGPNPELENSPAYILAALEKGYDVEVDLWFTDEGYFLGHDIPKYEIGDLLLINQIWFHCKTIRTAGFISGSLRNYFFHQTDDISITSKGYLWTYPGKLITSRSIAVLPETVPDWDIKRAYGVCTDYPLKYK